MHSKVISNLTSALPKIHDANAAGMNPKKPKYWRTTISTRNKPKYLKIGKFVSFVCYFNIM